MDMAGETQLMWKQEEESVRRENRDHVENKWRPIPEVRRSIFKPRCSVTEENLKSWLNSVRRENHTERETVREQRDEGG